MLVHIVDQFLDLISMTFFLIIIILCVTTPLELFRTKQESTGLFIKCLWKLIHSWINFIQPSLCYDETF